MNVSSEDFPLDKGVFLEFFCISKITKKELLAAMDIDLENVDEEIRKELEKYVESLRGKSKVLFERKLQGKRISTLRESLEAMESSRKLLLEIEAVKKSY